MDILLDNALLIFTREEMLEGEMVRFMAENDICDPEEIKAFDWRGYRFVAELSNERKFVFLRDNNRNL